MPTDSPSKEMFNTFQQGSGKKEGAKMGETVDIQHFIYGSYEGYRMKAWCPGMDAEADSLASARAEITPS